MLRIVISDLNHFLQTFLDMYVCDKYMYTMSEGAWKSVTSHVSRVSDMNPHFTHNIHVYTCVYMYMYSIYMHYAKYMYIYTLWSIWTYRKRGVYTFHDQIHTHTHTHTHTVCE